MLGPMEGLPLALALPAATAAITYLDARLSLSHDVGLLSTLLGGRIGQAIVDKRDRWNAFYLLEERAQSPTYCNQSFIVHRDREWSYSQTYEKVLRYGAWLKQRYGVRRNEIVAMDFMNSDTFIFLWFGLWAIGARPAFINYNLQGKALEHCLRASTARLLFVDPDIRPSISDEVLTSIAQADFRSGDSTGPVEVVVVTPDVEAEIDNVEPERSPDGDRAGARRSDMAILIYTSGTTGLPKPAIVSWLKASFAPRSFARLLRLRKTDRIYTCMPLYHSSAALIAAVVALRAGCAICIGRKFSTATFWDEVRASRATVIQYVGETCRYLLSSPPTDRDKEHNVRLAYGNGLRPDVWEKFKERFGIDGIAEFYAATEGPNGLWNRSNNDYSAGAVGRIGALVGLLLGPSVAVIDLDTESGGPRRDPTTSFCRRVKTGQAGELLFRLDAAAVETTYQGYFGNKGASSSKVLRDVFRSGDAWFRTGDLLRTDQAGRRWYFADRIGDTFRWKAENVSTAEVGQVLGLHPAVADANVYGVALPAHDGRAGCAAVVLLDPADHAPMQHGSAREQAMLDSVAAHVCANLPAYARPLFLRIGPTVRATGNNKQQKHDLRQDGVDPAVVLPSRDRLFWLKDGRYLAFGAEEWQAVTTGRVKL